MSSNADYVREWRASKTKKGLCNRCFKRKARDGKKSCRVCRKNMREDKRNAAAKKAKKTRRGK